MKLQKISILFFVVILTIFLLFVSIFFSTILLSSYCVLEEQYIEKNLEQAYTKINDELFRMATISSDWGPWDDTVGFVNEKNINYINSNLQFNTFDNLDLNIIVFANTDGEVVYSGSYDLQNKVMVPVPDFFSSRLDPGNPLMNMSDTHHVTKGILMVPENPLLVVSQPIVYSNYSGPAQGVIIMGRYLNTEEISRLRTLTRPSLTFKRIDDPSLSPNLVSDIIANKSMAPGYIKTLNSDQVAGFTLIHDIYGNNALILQITERREIYHQGLNTTRQVIIIILIGSLFLGLAIIILLNHLVLRKMRSIAIQVIEIGHSGSTSNRVKIQGDDELSTLAQEINRMLETIEQIQKKLQESESQFRELVESLPDYIVVYGLNMEIVYINPAAARAIGHNAETIIGVPVLSLIAEESRDTVIDQIASGLESGMIPIYDIEILTKDGVKKSVIVKGTKIHFNNHPAIFLLLIDITQRKELEQERELHEQELERYSSSLQKAHRQLNLLSCITRHDILNKISIIYGYLGLAELECTDPQILEYLVIMNKATEEIQSQIEFTRVYEDLGMQEPQWQKLDVIITHLSRPATIILLKDFQDVSIFADSMLEKVFFNLLDNSVRHGQHVTEIVVSAHESEGNLIVVWQDNGIGIAEEEKEKIFERGFGKNTGLGMFLVREILSLTDITIKETGVLGKGARFEIIVPKEAYQVN